MDLELEFELEESLLSSPAAINNNNKRSKKNVIGLDDLVEEFKQNKEKEARKKEKRAKARKRDELDDYERRKEAALFRVVDECHKQVSALSGEEENLSWGLELFQNQKNRPVVSFLELGSSMLLQSCMKDEINTLLELNSENGESFLEGLLVNGWLKKLVFIDGLLEDSVGRWTFDLLLYSSSEELRKSACDFWLDILASQQGIMPIKVEWYPCYSDLKSALAIYGFVFNSSSDNETVYSGSEHCGPPQNVRCWIRIIRSCCQVRNRRSFFSSSEAEELLAVIICLLLDRKLQGLSFLMHECLQSAMDYFTDNEWNSSCEKIANSLVSRVPRDLNCVKIVECIGGANIRAQQLRHAVSYKFLVSCFDDKVTDEDILERLVAINVKEKNCDLLKMFIYLVLVENWLLLNPILKDKPAVKDLWGVLLRNCSCQISSTDLRSYASKVRDRASFVLQGTVDKFVATV